MSYKTRLLRSLLLEPLECRSVFSVDGMDAWLFAQPTMNLELDQYQPAQYPRIEGVILNFESEGSLQSYDRNHFGDIQDEFIFEGRPVYEFYPHHDRFDEEWNPLLLKEEGEDSFDHGHPSGPESGPAQAHPQTTGTKSDAIVDRPSVPVLTQQHDSNQVNVPLTQGFSSNLGFSILGSSSSIGAINTPTGLAGGNSPRDQRPTTSIAQNTAASSPLVSVSSLGAQVNAASSSPSAFAVLASGTGTTTFDFSSRPSSISERPSAQAIGSQRANDFTLTRPQPVPADSIFERAESVESLDSLLSGLAEKHRRSRMQNGFDADQLNSRNSQDWRPESAVSEEIIFADGGMIALALDRDIALSEIEDFSEDARSEKKAWTANVGIYRAFENGAVAATENNGLTNRGTRKADSISATPENSESESEVAKSQMHPLLASTSAALGAVMFGLRRIRKSSPLMFTARKPKGKLG